jgi:hypothetical protein
MICHPARERYMMDDTHRGPSIKRAASGSHLRVTCAAACSMCVCFTLTSTMGAADWATLPDFCESATIFRGLAGPGKAGPPIATECRRRLWSRVGLGVGGVGCQDRGEAIFATTASDFSTSGVPAAFFRLIQPSTSWRVPSSM